jgi:hypothetical protein
MIINPNLRNRDYKKLTTTEEFVAFYKRNRSAWSQGRLEVFRWIDEETYQPELAVYNPDTKEAAVYTMELAQDSKDFVND